MGKPLMPWQQYVADVGLEIDEAGRFCYALVIVTVPRQSGKTTLFGGVMSQRALVTPRARVWFTMQTAKDAVDWLTNEHWPLLGPFGNAASIRRMAGSEHVRWHASGGLVRPFPPNATGLHSKVSDLVVVDECWAFDLIRGQQIDQAIVPTQATRPNAQVWKCSTAGDATSLWWLGTVEVGRASAEMGRVNGVAYFEWSAGDELDVTDPSAWPLYHPAYGRTIDADSMQAALDMLGPDEFARAYGNRWVSMVARVIPLAAWRAAADVDAPIPTAGHVALGFDVALDRSDAAIVAAYRDSGGLAHVEVADYRPGVAWLPERMTELREKWAPVAVAHDAAGPALDVADVLTRGGAELDGLKGHDYAAACAAFLEALVSGTVRVRPHPALDAAAAAAARRALGDAWAWGRRQSATSISALTAATLALWAYDHAPAALGPFRIM
jgi:phage terminase large subunit-like protein